MAKVNYSFYLLKVLSKKWGLYLASLISFVVIISAYIITIKRIQADNSNMLLSHPEWTDRIQSGLISKQLNLVLAFISLIPFVTYLSYTLFKAKASTDLVLFTKTSNRLFVIAQKYFVSFIIILLNSVVSLVAISIVAMSDGVLSTHDKNMWIVSMFFGHFIASVFLFFLALLLMNFMNVLPALSIVLGVSIALPLATVVLSKNNNTVTLERIATDEKNSIAILKWKPYDEQVDKLEADTNSYTYYYAANAKMTNLGAAYSLDKTRYDNYAQWDSWSALSNIFNIFSTKKSSIKVRGSWTEKVKLKDFMKLDDSNSTLVGDKRYLIVGLAASGRQVNNDDFTWWNNDEWYSYYYHGKKPNDENYDENMFEISMTDKRDANHNNVHSIEYANVVNNFNSLINLLKTNDGVAKEYKALTFAEQAAIFGSLIFDYNHLKMQPIQLFGYIKQSLTDENSYKWYTSLSQVMTLKLNNSNPTRFSPSTLFPNTDYWNGRMDVINNLTREVKYEDLTHEVKNRNMISSDDTINVPHYNEELEPNLGIKVFWLTLFVLTIPISIFTYVRKDFN